MLGLLQCGVSHLDLLQVVHVGISVLLAGASLVCAVQASRTACGDGPERRKLSHHCSSAAIFSTGVCLVLQEVLLDNVVLSDVYAEVSGTP